MKATSLVVTVLMLAAVLALACSPSDSQLVQANTVNGSTPAETPSTTAEIRARPDRMPLVKGPVSLDGLQAILGTADLGVGEHRVGFVLVSSEGFVTEPSVSLTSRYFSVAGSEGVLGETIEASYQPWPYGNRGLYTARLNFDLAGSWALEIVASGADGAFRSAELSFEVAQTPSAPMVGAKAIASVTKTTADVDSLEQLSTGSLQDPELYQVTLAEAVTSGKPTVVVFASPAFCSNEVCGPQVEVLQELNEEYKGRANFIHVDFYDNPDEIQGDLDRATLSPSVLEWALPSIEWTFVIDAEGTVTARFEGFVTLPEVDAALRMVL